MNNFLITGANSDFGKTLIKKLTSDKSNRILAISRSQFDYKLEANIFFIDGIDLTIENDLNRIAFQSEEFFKEKFTFIHCVGDFWYHKPITHTSFDEATKMMDSHYNTLFGCIKVLIPLFKKLKGGRIIAFSCNSVGFTYPEMAAFTSAKAAVETLIKCVANENSKYGIIVNAIALSTIKTEKVLKSKLNKYHDSYISMEELMAVIDNLINSSPLINGNVIKLLKYSKHFHTEGYFQRNPSNYEVD